MAKKNKTGRNNPGRNPRGHPNANRIATASEPPPKPEVFTSVSNYLTRVTDLKRAKKQGLPSRFATPENIPEFLTATVAKGVPARGDAELASFSEGYYSANKNNIKGLRTAKALNPLLGIKPSAMHYVVAQELNAQGAGTIRMINKNGSRVPIGNTDPRLSSRSTFSMLDEIDQIIANPRSTAGDNERVRQLLRMVHIRNQIEEDEYHARHPASAHEPSRFSRVREHVENIYRRLRNTTSSLRERASSGVRGFLQGAVARISGVNGGRVTNRSSRSRSRTPGGTRRSSRSRSRTPGGTRRRP